MPHAHLNDVDLFYEVTGQGAPIVFSHEFGGGYASWEPQVRYLARWYRCVTYNHRGFPPSTVPENVDDYSQDILIEDLRGLVAHLGLGPIHLVGLSLGGNVALNFALRHPDLCRSVVVAGTGTGSVNRAQFERDAAEIVRTLEAEGMAGFAARYSQGATRQPLRRKDPRGWEEFHQQLAAHSARGSALTVHGVMLARPSIFALESQLRQMRVPTLVLVGDEDEPCLDPAVFMKRVIPTAGLVVLPQSGHTINLEDPALFNQIVLSFIRSVEHGRWATRPGATDEWLPPRG